MCSKFSMVKVTDSFMNSLKDEDDVLLDHYIDGFWEINKFFQLMGSVFGFVSSEVQSKLEILQDLRKQKEINDSKEFESFKEMIEYEKSKGLLQKSDYVSGSRTLLRLHRGLEFLNEFLCKLNALSMNDGTHKVCQSAYECTLAKHHPWIVRQGAYVAMWTLPTREQLLKKVCHEIDEAISALPDMLEVAKVVHQRTENLYTKYDLHGLP